MKKNNEKLLENFLGLPCIICGSEIGTTGHYIMDNDDDEAREIEENIIPLCCEHRSEVEEGVFNEFYEVYQLEDELFMRGFEKKDISEGHFEWIFIGQ